MRKFKLRNGLTVLYEKRKSESVAIEVCVCTGSNNEPGSVAGISHFLEHMMFEGTTTRTSKQISEAIENSGGELNAATANERTYYYVKIPRAKVRLGLDILSDMMKNPSIGQKSLDKERKVILEEIKMVNDQPMFYQWVLFQKFLFKRHPTKNPVYGRFDSVKAITRKKMLEYYRKWYSPGNMILSIVGDIKDTKGLAESYFGDMKQSEVPKPKKVVEPRDTKATINNEKRNITQAYMVLGYKTVPRMHKDSAVLDVISAVFSKGLSGRISDEIRVKRGLAYVVGSAHESRKDFGFFVFHLNCAKKNLELCKSIIIEEIRKLSNIGNKELNDAKENIIGKILLSKEDSQKAADDLAFWEFINDARLADKYLRDIRKVTKNDLVRVRDRFMHKNYTQIIISR